MMNLRNLLLQLIVAVTMVTMVLDFFFVDPTIQSAGTALGSFVIPIAGLATGMGAIILALYYIGRIRRREQYWQYNIIGMSMLLAMIAIGFFEPGQQVVFRWVSTSMVGLIETAVFSISIFFMVSAAYRSLRLKTLEAALLLLTALLVMFGNAPVGDYVWGGSSSLANWIMNVPSSAGMRGLNIAVAVGTFVIAVRTLLGRERTVIGG